MSLLADHTLDALFPYQRDGIEWMRRRGSFLLADEMGLGKSLQILGDVANVAATSAIPVRTLLTAPNAVISNWAEEVAKWTTASVEVATGSPKQRSRAINAGADFTVIAYDNLQREIADLNDQGFYYLAFDEAHNIKSRKALRTKAAFNLRGAKRAMVTGSPMLNRVDELWPLLFMIAPREFGNYWSFANRYAVYGGYENKQIVGVQNAAELRTRMAPYMLRRTNAQVASQRPPKNSLDVLYDLTPYQRKMYDTAFNELKIEINGLTADEFDNPLVRFLRLRQIIGTPHAVGGEDSSGTLDMMVEKVDQIDRSSKIVIFSQFLGVIEAAYHRLSKQGESVAVIQGEGMTAPQRAQVVRDFQSDGQPRILLASYGVAREGINLYRANHAITLDRLWVPLLQDQAEARLDRTGQTREVTIHNLMPRNTVASRVEKILRTKRAVFDAVISGNDYSDRVIASAILDAIGEAA